MAEVHYDYHSYVPNVYIVVINYIDYYINCAIMIESLFNLNYILLIQIMIIINVLKKLRIPMYYIKKPHNPN